MNLNVVFVKLKLIVKYINVSVSCYSMLITEEIHKKATIPHFKTDRDYSAEFSEKMY